ncbi:MAG: hypothetical protein QG568_431 [Patescibacteria group bacterium]|nr:hypothetical protein [Patescibacteria group bacterium]
MSKYFTPKHIAILGIFIFVIFSTTALLLVKGYLDDRNEIEMTKVKTEKDNKDRIYVASQKDACLSVYKQESSKFNNVRSWRYDADNDSCVIVYKDTIKKTETQCTEEFTDKDTGKFYTYKGVFTDYLNCREGQFERSY